MPPVIAGILPDGKAQVTVEYEDGEPVRLSSVVVSCQHREDKLKSVPWNGPRLLQYPDSACADTHQSGFPLGNTLHLPELLLLFQTHHPGKSVETCVAYPATG